MIARLALAWITVGGSELTWATWAKPMVGIIYNVSDSALPDPYIVPPGDRSADRRLRRCPLA